MITFACPNCRNHVKVAKVHAGRKGKCPSCQTSIEVPHLTPDRSAADQPAVPLAEPAHEPATVTPPQATPAVLAGLDPREYEHPLDKKALDALQQMRGFDYILRKYTEHIGERIFRLIHTGSNIQVTREGFPDLAAAFERVCHTLDLSFVPELYIQWDYSINAMAVGVERPFVVINSGCIDLFTPSELSFVLGHEVGHIKSGHMLYHQLAQLFPILGNIIGEATLGLGRLVTSGMDVALFYWSRMSEFTADRAGMLACQDEAAALTAMVKMAGLPKTYFDRMPIQAFIEQARQFKGFDTSALNWAAKIMLTMHMDHPWTVMRASEILGWIEKGDYQRVLQRSSAAGGMCARTPHLGDSRTRAAAIAASAENEEQLLTDIRGALAGTASGKAYVAPGIPQDKLVNAMSSYAEGASAEQIIFLYDDTMFGGAKEGFCLTRDTLYWHNLGEERQTANLRDIRSLCARRKQGFFDSNAILVDGGKISISIDNVDELARVIQTVRRLTDVGGGDGAELERGKHGPCPDCGHTFPWNGCECQYCGRKSAVPSS